MHVSLCSDRIAIKLIHKKLLWCVLDTVLSREMGNLTWLSWLYIQIKAEWLVVLVEDGKPWVVQCLMEMHARDVGKENTKG